MSLPSDEPRVSLLRAALSQDELDSLLANAFKNADALLVERAIELLELGADPNASLMGRAQSALYLAIGSTHPGSLKLVRSLLAHGANPNALIPRAKQSALHLLMSRANVSADPNANEKIKALADAGANLNAVNFESDTPLTCLCSLGLPGDMDRRAASMARQLVVLGVDPNAARSDGLSPFELAAQDPGERGGGLALMRELLDLGARVDERTLSRCRRAEPSEAFLLFIQSIRDRLALEKGLPALPAAANGARL